MRRRILIIPVLAILLAATTTYNEIVLGNNKPLQWADFSHNHQDDNYAAVRASGLPRTVRHSSAKQYLPSSNKLPN